MNLYANGQRQLKADLQVAAQHRDEKRAERRAKYIAERDAAPITVPEMLDARFVSIRHVGWRQVVRVNPNTVTVQEPNAFDGIARYPHKNIIGAKQ